MLSPRRAPDRAPAVFTRPGRVIIRAFATTIAIGTVLLMLPWSASSGRATPWDDALFTATSSVCVTGLVTVDTGSYWSPFGQVVILILIQVGGLGIMSLATLVAVMFSRRLGLRMQKVAKTETRSLASSDVRRVIRQVVVFSVCAEAIVAVVLATRFAVVHGDSWGKASWEGVFHAVSAFNNAGFSTYSGSLTRFGTDSIVLITVALAVIVGGLGFPVWFELARAWRRPRTWSTLTRITVAVSAALLVLGPLVYFITEFSNPGTLGPMDTGQKAVSAFFSGVMPRTAGFNSIDLARIRDETAFATDVLMFIGGGSAGTAGGIKVTTFGVLGYIIWAQVRGDPNVRVGPRRLSAGTERQAVSVALLAIGFVVLAVLVLLPMTTQGFQAVLFEVVSAFSTVGMTLGVTDDLPPMGELMLVVLMFVGRIGPLTLMTGLALRQRRRLSQVPEERIILG